MDSDSDLDSPPLPVPPPKEIPAMPQSSHSHSRSSSKHSDKRLKGAELEDVFRKLTAQLQAERRRADEAEQRCKDLFSNLKSVNDARLKALQEAARASEALELYKIQFDNAQREIYRAQDVINLVDRQRLQAEQDAAKARSTIRKLNEERLIQLAREEGRRMGLQEGLERGRHLAFEERRTARPSQPQSVDSQFDDSQSLNDETLPTTRNPTLENLHIQIQSDRLRSPTPPRIVPPPQLPVQIPPRSITPTASPIDDHPINIRNQSFTPRMTHGTIPPDNFIPVLDNDNRIRLPPPHDLQRPPPTPERESSPALPLIPENEGPIGVPRTRSTTPKQGSRSHRHSSPESSSTTISQFPMVNEPQGSAIWTPMSAITEVLSDQNSPNPQYLDGPQGLHRQPSLGGSSSRQHQTTQSLSSERGTPHQGFYSRPQRASSTSTLQPPPGPPQDQSTYSSTPDIDVQPPSRPDSMSTVLESQVGLMNFGHPSYSSRSPQLRSEAHTPLGFASRGYTENHPQAQTAMPGIYTYPHTHQSESVENEEPVIPAPGLYGTDSEDDAVSSAMDSPGSLTTPPQPQQQLHHRTSSGVVSNTGWGSGSGIYSNRSNSRPLSRSTNRSRNG